MTGPYRWKWGALSGAKITPESIEKARLRGTSDYRKGAAFLDCPHVAAELQKAWECGWQAEHARKVKNG